MISAIVNPITTIESRLYTGFGLTTKYDFMSPPPKVGAKGKAIHRKMMRQTDDAIDGYKLLNRDPLSIRISS